MKANSSFTKELSSFSCSNFTQFNLRLQSLSDILSNRTSIGIKRVGELNENIFHGACIKKYRKDIADVKAVELCSKWQDELKKPEWHPFKMVTVNGKLKV